MAEGPLVCHFSGEMRPCVGWGTVPDFTSPPSPCTTPQQVLLREADSFVLKGFYPISRGPVLDGPGWVGLSPGSEVPSASFDLSPLSCCPRHVLLWPLLRGVHQERPGLHEVRYALHFCRGEGCAPGAFSGSLVGPEHWHQAWVLWS